VLKCIDCIGPARLHRGCHVTLSCVLVRRGIMGVQRQRRYGAHALRCRRYENFVGRRDVLQGIVPLSRC
jgi:hypothetical protein